MKHRNPDDDGPDGVPDDEHLQELRGPACAPTLAALGWEGRAFWLADR